MPSKSPAQMRMMAAVAHDPKFAKKVGVPQQVGQEFNEADQGLHRKALAEALRKPSGAK